MALAGRRLIPAERGTALTGRTRALVGRKEPGGEGVEVCLADKGL